ncbi:lysophospholipid acyltransferase family protein [Alsobacter sp. SYSU M60028]|uniref:Lysophospholipid acyltransferase family protein n=1 Tax=Alsobacter ponti TaxID=2962936 RepID=A0ABT1LE90_9HYPH|nr:lysophospholipid acyltransferase family protein [Alsobacter ponti]MCP8939218.1 lysophospholipid acyltransferase family protein [Alsobacter ponti]
MRTPRWALRALGRGFAAYLRLVRRTSRMTLDPPDLFDRLEPDWPFVCALWHGQHFMIPLGKRPQDRYAVLISRSDDGEINAAACEAFDIRPVRASGGDPRKMRKRGGVYGLREMLRALEQGDSVTLTADIPKRARVAGLGIVTLARLSGRPIYPCTVVSNRRVTLGNWDRTTVALPFGRLVLAVGEPVRVARDADEAALERARLAVQAGLDEVHARAYGILGLADPGARLRDAA